MKKATFYATIDAGAGTIERVPWSGWEFTKYIQGRKHAFIVHPGLFYSIDDKEYKKTKGWIVSEKSTGKTVVTGPEKTRADAIENANRCIDKAIEEGANFQLFVDLAIKENREREKVQSSA